jgi:hypothetical protein
MKKIIFVILLFASPLLMIAQSYTFTTTMYSIYTYGVRDDWKHSPNNLKVENLGGGKYKIGVQEGGYGSFSDIYVKYSRMDGNTYAYKPYYHNDDNMYSEVTLVGADVKLSKMASGTPGTIVIYFYPQDVGAALKCIK